VNAVAALESVYTGRIFKSKEPTPWALAKALRTLTGAWGMNHDAVSARAWFFGLTFSAALWVFIAALVWVVTR
jgi:hypothetical protein